MIRPWKKSRSEPLGDFRVFRLREDRSVSPRNGSEHKFIVLDAPDWVNIIALTESREMVLVEQFRHGSETIELEVPGGVRDAADASPVETAVRELREETGFEGENALVIGDVWPNPAIQSNRCFTILIENCRLKHPVDFDHGEDLSTHLMPATEVPRLVAQGRIRHSLAIVALYHFELWQRGLKEEPASRPPTP